MVGNDMSNSNGSSMAILDRSYLTEGRIFPKPVDISSTTELLAAHGHIKFNSVRTIRQAWDKLNSTPYHPSKAAQYSMLRQLMLKEYDKGV